MKKRILLYYKYTHFENPEEIKQWQQDLCQSLGLTGRIIIAHEGINGTVAGYPDATEAYIKAMNEHPLCQDIDFKDSYGADMYNYFEKLSIKVRPEIVTLGAKAAACSADQAGVHLSPEKAHQMMEQGGKDLVILDGRNYYEARIGTFNKAITPNIETFKQFPDFIDDNLELFKDKEVLMACTGGIRCERASAYLKSKNVAKEVYQITGGIHRYAEQFPDGFFRGKNYVFDQRLSMSVTGEVIATCDVCNEPCDDYTNCANASCNKRFIGCMACIEKLDNACSTNCYELVLGGLVKRRPKRIRAQEAMASGVQADF